MKILTFITFCGLAVSSFAQQTAYKAMNVVGGARGDRFLDQLLAMEGLGGASQPNTWRLVFQDSGSRGGFREIEVQDGKIVGQRAPSRNPFEEATKMNLDRLQLDSDGAFTVAEQEAIRRRITFDSANYLLQTDEKAGVPVWHIDLISTSGRKVLSLNISAGNGRILGGRGGGNGRSEDREPQEDREDPPVRDVPEDREERDISDSDSTEQKIHRTMVNTGRSIGHGFRRVGGSLQEVFTGRRTIDRDVP